MSISMSRSSRHHHAPPFPSCFRPTTASSADNRSRKLALPPPPSPSPSPSPHLIPSNPNLTTSLYHTGLGLFALTWSRTLFGRSLHLHFLLNDFSNDSNSRAVASFHSLSTPSFHLDLKPFFFWKRYGSKKLCFNNAAAAAQNVRIFWDFSRANFGSGPEPQSGFYIAVVVAGEMTLLVGDSPKEAFMKTRAKPPGGCQAMVLRREHVYGSNMYTTRATIGGRTRDITIDCRLGDDPRLYFSVDNKRVLQIKHLKWKFRGNEKIDVDGVHVLVSWDVYNWLFEDDEEGYALFMFKFEGLGFEDEDVNLNDKINGKVLWSQQSCGLEFETNKMKKGSLRSRRSSSSSSSLSSASSSCSSVIEWATNEDNELKGPSGFSLLVYAWKS